jgi:hypothetical protein
MRTHVIALGICVMAFLGGIRLAHACGLDGIPSLTVNGTVVMVNRVQPLPGRLSTWAPFSTRGVYPAGTPVLLAEIRSRVLWTLPPSALSTPWRWTFGDGTQAQGLSVRHTYRHAGAYVVGVRAYLRDGTNTQWYLFDTAVLHVR